MPSPLFSYERCKQISVFREEKSEQPRISETSHKNDHVLALQKCSPCWNLIAKKVYVPQFSNGRSAILKSARNQGDKNLRKKRRGYRSLNTAELGMGSYIGSLRKKRAEVHSRI